MFIMDSETQAKIDARQKRHGELAEDAQRELNRCMYRPGGVRADALEPENRAMYLGQTPQEQALKRADAHETAPNAFAIRELVRMFCTDSPKAKTREWRADAGEARLFALMLQHVVQAVTPTMYVREQARSIFPIDTSIPAGAETVLKQRVIDEDLAPVAGSFGEISPRGDDVLIVEVSGTSETHNLVSFARGVEWSIDELEAAAFAGVQLRQEKMAALNRAVERIFDMVAFQGYASAGITGAYNNAAPALTVPTTGAWAAATADQIVADVHDLIEAITLATGYNYRPSRLVIPSVLTEFLSLRRANTDLNVRTMIQQDFPGLSIVECDRANLYDVAGTGPRIMAFTPDPMMLNIAVPRNFTLEPPEKHGFRYRLIGRQKLGGCIMSMPLTVGYMDGC